MTSPDELADALAHEAAVDRGGYVDRDELRTLARDAAKQALEEAADAYDDWADTEWEAPHAGAFLRARAEQIGEAK